MVAKCASAKSMIWWKNKLNFCLFYLSQIFGSLKPLLLFWLLSGSHIGSVFFSYSACSDPRFPKIASYVSPRLPASRTLFRFQNCIGCTSSCISFWAAIFSMNTSLWPNWAYVSLIFRSLRLWMKKKLVRLDWNKEMRTL